MTVSALRAIVEELSRIPPDQQRLLFAGKQLDEDEDTLSMYNIKAGDIVTVLLRLKAGGKRGRAASAGGGARSGDDDKQTTLANMRTEYVMKAQLLQNNTIAFIAQAAAEISGRQDHDAWLNQQIDNMDTKNLTAIRDAFVVTTNSQQKVRVLTKYLFEQRFNQITEAETSLRMAKSMPGGLFDQYVMFVVASRYMSEDASLDWTPFKDALEQLIRSRLRAEGAAAVRAEMRD
jgi:hypothetical protein